MQRVVAYASMYAINVCINVWNAQTRIHTYVSNNVNHSNLYYVSMHVSTYIRLCVLYVIHFLIYVMLKYLWAYTYKCVYQRIYMIFITQQSHMDKISLPCMSEKLAYPLPVLHYYYTSDFHSGFADTWYFTHQQKTIQITDPEDKQWQWEGEGGRGGGSVDGSTNKNLYYRESHALKGSVLCPWVRRLPSALATATDVHSGGMVLWEASVRHNVHQAAGHHTWSSGGWWSGFLGQPQRRRFPCFSEII